MINPLAEQILRELSKHPESGQIVLGGYFTLRRYVDYRDTQDIDAWWKTQADSKGEGAIRAAMAAVAEQQGFKLSERRFGETMSFELGRAEKTVFSFQIAVRSISLESPTLSDWPPLLVETLTDNVASKMNALVNRGSPRDFADIYHLVKLGHSVKVDCWDWWQRKNPSQSIEAAKQKVLLHLEALENRRPLVKITDQSERSKAQDVRAWYRLEFCR